MQFANYERAWGTGQLGTNFFNSVIIVGLSVLLILIVSAPASYILSRVNFRGRNLLTMISRDQVMPLSGERMSATL